MKITLRGVPEFIWSPTLEHIAVLMKLSGFHYDGTCKSAKDVGGFLYGWKNSVDAHIQFSPGEPITVRAKSHDLDICLKIMEMALPPMPLPLSDDEALLIREMRSSFHNALELADNIYREQRWHTESM